MNVFFKLEIHVYVLYIISHHWIFKDTNSMIPFIVLWLVWMARVVYFVIAGDLSLRGTTFSNPSEVQNTLVGSNSKFLIRNTIYQSV